MPVIPRYVAGNLINMVVGDSVVWPPVSQVFPYIPPDTRDYSEELVAVTFPDSEEFHRRYARLQMTSAELTAGIDSLVAALQRLPQPHLKHLSRCPILITTNLPSGEAPEHGGYYLPLGASGNPNYTVRRWVDRVAQTHLRFPPTDRTVNYEAGVIAVTTRNLKARPIGSTPRCQFTVLHEAGHCIDYNGDPAHPGHGLDSNPPDDSYRLGNHAYQGQKYPAPSPAGQTEGNLILPLPRRIYEFKAETYSRLFMGCASLCRQGEAAPPCLLGTGGHRGCNRRLQLDLAYSPAFRGLLTYLPLAVSEFRTSVASGH
jgi:hypothetical protein